MDGKITSPFFRGNRLHLLANAIQRQRQGWLFEEHGRDNFKAGTIYGFEEGLARAAAEVPEPGLNEHTYPYYAKGMLDGITSHDISIYSPEVIDPNTNEIRPIGASSMESLKMKYGMQYPNFYPEGSPIYKSATPHIKKFDNDVFVIDKKAAKPNLGEKYVVIDRRKLAGKSLEDKVPGWRRISDTEIEKTDMVVRDLVGELGNILKPTFKKPPPLPEIDFEAMADEGYKQKIGVRAAPKAPRRTNANKIEQAPRVEELPPTPIKRRISFSENNGKSKKKEYADLHSPNKNNQRESPAKTKTRTPTKTTTTTTPIKKTPKRKRR